MFRNKAIMALSLFGLLSFGSLSYFYLAHRSFMQEQREFLIHLNNLDSYNSDLTNEALNNSLFAYNSQDKIAYDYDAMQREFKKLQNSKILKNDSYVKIENNVNGVLQVQINNFLIKIQDFLLLNAAVKNSIVFLSSHVNSASYLQEAEPQLYVKAVKILDTFKDVRETQDLDYLHKEEYLLQSDSKSEKIQLFVTVFNLHTSYLIKKLPAFITTTNSVVENKIGDTLNKEKREFHEISLYDFALFDNFASVVFLMLIFYLLLAVYLFMRYRAANKSLHYSLSHDNLTGVYDRSSLVKDVSVLQEGKVILLLNIDAFKEINDVYGNEFGNSVLVKLAEYLEQYFRKMSGVNIYRVGGDEFVVLFINNSIDEIVRIGKNLAAAIRNRNFKINNIQTNLSASIAVNNTVPLLENADLALKVVKKDTNREVIEYKEELSIKKEWQKNIEVVNMVKSALLEDRIVPYFQGIVNLKTLKIEKYEALVRLILPSGEVLSPYAFLDIVSKTHYYYEITEVMIRKTMEVAKDFPQQRFSINFSMKDIINKNITTTLFRLFDRDKERAKRIDIELLETELVVVDDSRISDFITKVHGYGSKVLIDDFGTGYSNFSYLSDLDVDILKIDASITKEIITDPRKLHILKSIHNFTTGMDMQNVAEFVETKEVALLLKEIGVEYAQGYYFCKPIPKPLENSAVSL